MINLQKMIASNFIVNFSKRTAKLQYNIPAASFSTSKISAAPELNYQEFVEVLKNKSAVVVDVRNPEELRDCGEIPGTINIPLGDLEV